jgi:hypothetical protein
LQVGTEDDGLASAHLFSFFGDVVYGAGATVLRRRHTTPLPNASTTVASIARAMKMSSWIKKTKCGGEPADRTHVTISPPLEI